jgi:hypothetical protein
MARADKLGHLIDRAVTAVQRGAYCRPYQVECVYRKTEAGAFEPFCTTLSPKGWCEKDHLPEGEYRAIWRTREHDNDVLHVLAVTRHGYTSSSSTRNFAAETWFPAPAMKQWHFGDEVALSDDLVKAEASRSPDGLDSYDHVQEFKHCVGFVEGPMDPAIVEDTIVDVRWLPSGLRYAYPVDHLQYGSLFNIKDR